MSEFMHVIKGYSRIKKNVVSGNGKILFQSTSPLFDQFAEEAYRFIDIAYPKFYKMDKLSKLGFLTSEVLLKGIILKEKYSADKTGIILSNKSSSLDTDVKYYNNLKNGFASPAVFVYTLPNIMIGEICIRNGIKGENTFFVSDKYDIPSQVNYVNNLLDTGLVDACICGWVELMEETYDSFLYLVEKGEDRAQLKHSVENIEKLYLKGL